MIAKPDCIWFSATNSRDRWAGPTPASIRENESEKLQVSGQEILGPPANHVAGRHGDEVVPLLERVRCFPTVTGQLRDRLAGHTNDLHLGVVKKGCDAFWGCALLKQLAPSCRCNGGNAGAIVAVALAIEGDFVAQPVKQLGKTH